MTVEAPPRTHSLAPPSAGRSFLGRRETGEVIGLTAGGAAGIAFAAILSAVAGPLVGVCGFVIIAGTAAAVVFIPLPGGTLYRRAPRDLKFRHARRTGRLHYRSGAAQAGYVLTPGDDDTTNIIPVDVTPPAEVGRLKWLQTSFRGRPLGVVYHHNTGALTACLEVEGPGVGMFDTDDLLSAHSRYSAVRRDIANDDGFVTHLAQLTRTLPADTGSHADHVTARGAADAPPVIVAAYDEQLARTEAYADQHRSYQIVRLDPSMARGKAVRLAGGGDAGMCAVVAREVDAVAAKLEDAGFTVVGPLSAAGTCGLIRNTYNPGLRLDDTDSILPRDAWPTDMERGADQVVCDGWHHAAAVIRLPTRPVTVGFLMPMLVQAPGVIRTLTVVDRLVTTDTAMDVALEHLTHAAADDSLQAKDGQVADPRMKLVGNSTAELAYDLADGAAATRTTMFLLLSAPGADELANAIRSYRSRIVRSWCRPDWLTKEHAAGLVCCLPFAEGVR